MCFSNQTKRFECSKDAVVVRKCTVHCTLLLRLPLRLCVCASRLVLMVLTQTYQLSLVSDSSSFRSCRNNCDYFLHVQMNGDCFSRLFAWGMDGKVTEIKRTNTPNEICYESRLRCVWIGLQQEGQGVGKYSSKKLYWRVGLHERAILDWKTTCRDRKRTVPPRMAAILLLIVGGKLCTEREKMKSCGWFKTTKG